MIGRAAARRRIFVSLCSLLALGWQGTCLAERVITRVQVRPGLRETVIAVFTSGGEAGEVKSFALHDPPRLVFDLPGARLSPDLPSIFPVEGRGLRQIRLGQFSADPETARLVVDLSAEAAAPACEVSAGEEPGETLITLGRGGPVALRPPTLDCVEGAVLVRIAGAAELPRTVSTLRDPPRVYADLTDARVEEVYRQQVERGPVREVRMAGQPQVGQHAIARLVVELREEQAYTVFCDGDDLIVAVGPQPWALPLPKYQGRNRLQGRRIVVDPGHGGEDIGAPAVFGPLPERPFEKDIVLDIARRLAKLLEAEGAAVTMTREDDRFVSLAERAAIANRMKAEAFISIHCNAYDAPDTLQGTSVYYDHGDSADFARLVQTELIAALGTTDRGVRNANFAVIRRAEAPGILVETAYINHAGDRARLIHPNFRERAARAIVQGLMRFLAEERAAGGQGS